MTPKQSTDDPMRFPIFSAALLLQGVLLLAIGPHFDEQHFWKMLMYEGAGYGKDFHGRNDLIGWQQLFQWLYQLKPQISWYPMAILLLCSVSNSLFIKIIYTNVRHQNIPWPVTLTIYLTLLALLVGNVLMLHHNRPAFLMCGSALLASCIVISDGSNKVHWLFFFWFAGGFLFRFEAGLATLVALAPLPFLLKDGLTVNQTLRTFWPHIALAAAVVSVHLYHTANNSSFYYGIEPDVEYELSDRGRVMPLAQMRTAADSAKYEAITRHWMLGDTQITTPKFMRSLVDKPQGAWHRFLFFLYPSGEKKDGWSPKLCGLWKAYWPVFSLMLVLWVLAAAYAPLESSLKLILFLLFSLAILSSSFSVNSLGRVTEPMMGVLAAAFCAATLRLQNWPHLSVRMRTLFSATMAALAVSFIVPRLAEAVNVSRKLVEDEQVISERVSAMMDTSQRSMVLPLMDFTATNTPALEPFQGFGNKQLLLVEAGQFSGNFHFNRTIAEVTGCPMYDFACRMRFVARHRKDIIIIARQGSIQMLERYMAAVHDEPIQILPAQEVHLHGNTFFYLPR
jgi:hypothetical protein